MAMRAAIRQGAPITLSPIPAPVADLPMVWGDIAGRPDVVVFGQMRQRIHDPNVRVVVAGRGFQKGPRDLRRLRDRHPKIAAIGHADFVELPLGLCQASVLQGPRFRQKIHRTPGQMVVSSLAMDRGTRTQRNDVLGGRPHCRIVGGWA